MKGVVAWPGARLNHARMPQGLGGAGAAGGADIATRPSSIVSARASRAIRRAWPRATGAPGDRLRGSTEPGREMILAEAYRRVVVEEDGAEIELSTHEAVLRAMATAARQGNQTAQHRWTQLVKAAEAEQKRAQIALYNVLERKISSVNGRTARGRMVPCSSYQDDIVVDLA